MVFGLIDKGIFKGEVDSFRMSGSGHIDSISLLRRRKKKSLKPSIKYSFFSRFSEMYLRGSEFSHFPEASDFMVSGLFLGEIS